MSKVNIMFQIDNLVFSGGALKGIVYAGCMEALEEFDILSTIKRISGTSVGAMFAHGILLC